MGSEALQKYDEAVKRFNDNSAQAKAKSAPKGGVAVTASMIVLAPDLGEITPIACAAVRVSDDYYAIMDSGTTQSLFHSIQT